MDKLDSYIRAHKELTKFLEKDSSFKKRLYAELNKECIDLLREIRFRGPKKNVELAELLDCKEPNVTRRADKLRRKFNEIAGKLDLPEIILDYISHGDYRGLILRFSSNTPEDIERCIGILNRYGQVEADTDSSLLFVLDGITYSRVGELVFPDSAIDENRYIQARAYQKSLEDFVFAIAISDNLGVNRDYWPILGSEVKHQSARTLLNKIAEKAGEEVLRPVGFASDESSLGDLSYQIIKDFVETDAGDLIEEDVQSLAYVDWDPWMRLLFREVNKNMNPDKSESKKVIQLSESNFKKSYVFRDRFNKCFPPELLKKGQKIVKSLQPDITVNDSRDFVLGAIITHVCIGLYYACISESMPYHQGYQDYLPCETRATLVASAAKQQLSQQQVNMARIQRLLLPYCLVEVLKKCHHRDQFVESAFDIRDLPKIAMVRKRILNIRKAMEIGNNKDVQTLVKEINLEEERSDNPSVLEQWVKVFDNIPHRARWAQQLVEGTGGSELLKIQENLAKIFPEIYGHQNTS